MKLLDDTDEMPFGIHKGKAMQDVPAQYLHYLWHRGLKTEDRPVAAYIRKNLPALKHESPDLLWD